MYVFVCSGIYNQRKRVLVLLVTNGLFISLFVIKIQTFHIKILHSYQAFGGIRGAQTHTCIQIYVLLNKLHIEAHISIDTDIYIHTHTNTL